MMNRLGQQFGNYRLVKFLGQGGFAEVYLGEHVLMGASAAIKILNAQLVATDSRRFIQEARTLVTLEHPYIVRVKECGIEGGIPFLVMDYAPNGTLRQRHPGGTPVPLEQVVSYVSQIADALQYAHDRGFIHRDVKPENMLVGRSGEVLLSDFGIAVMLASSSIRYTKDSAGTAIYMAPEQIERQAVPASDQYALGIVVYEWLCGEIPFKGSFGEITAKHLHTQPPSFREKGVNIPPAVEGIVMKALAKKPEGRFASVKGFALALQQSSPQQMTHGRRRDSWRDDSLILAGTGQPAPFTDTPTGVRQQPPAPVITPSLARSTPAPEMHGVPTQAFTPPAPPDSIGLARSSGASGAPPTPPYPYSAPYQPSPGSFMPPGQLPRRQGPRVGLIIGIIALVALLVAGGSIAIFATRNNPTATTSESTSSPPNPSVIPSTNCEVTGIDPTSGPEDGGTKVTIDGSGFTGDTQVSFGSTAASSFTFIRDTQITAVSPAGSGAVDVTVSGCTSEPINAGQFTYIPRPTLRGIDPQRSALTITKVTITGSYFNGATSVSFGSVPADSFIIVSDGEITAYTTHPHTTTTVDVTVTTPGGTSNPVQFTYYIIS